VSTRRGRRYFITFTDDATRYTFTYLLAAKSAALPAYREFEAWARTQNHCTAIKVLRSGHGGEYLSKAFDEHLAATGTAAVLLVDSPSMIPLSLTASRSVSTAPL
jgi:hypothetical protein